MLQYKSLKPPHDDFEIIGDDYFCYPLTMCLYNICACVYNHTRQYMYRI